MNRYKDSVALRRGLEVRLKQESDASGMDLGRLRRRVVFDRVAARLAAAPGGGWVLKGGAALEFRLLDRARMTKDLDLAIRTTQPDGTEVRESLIDALAADPDQDGFQLPRLRSGLLMSLEIPDISECNHESASADVASFMHQIRRYGALQRGRSELLINLRPSILNAAFTGQL